MDTVTIIGIVGALLIAALCVVGGLYALVKQKVVVDDSGHVTAIEIPLLGKLSTNYPSIAAVVLGVLLAYGVYYKIDIKPDTMTITAQVAVQPEDLQGNPQVFVGVIPQEYHVMKNVMPGTPRAVPITVAKGNNYHVIVYTVTGVENGSAIKVIDDGAVEPDGIFRARLRVR